MILLSAAGNILRFLGNNQSILTTIHHGLSYLCGTLSTATGQIVAGQINFVATRTISGTLTPPKPSSSNGHNVLAAVVPTSSAVTVLLVSVPTPLIQPHIYQHRRLPNLRLHRALTLTLTRLAGLLPPRSLKLGWVNISNTAVYLIS